MGIPLYTPGERIRRLDEACEIARRLFTEPTGEQRTLRVVARHADSEVLLEPVSEGLFDSVRRKQAPSLTR